VCVCVIEVRVIPVVGRVLAPHPAYQPIRVSILLKSVQLVLHTYSATHLMGERSIACVRA
jgi:hypothetical protein